MLGPLHRHPHLGMRRQPLRRSLHGGEGGPAQHQNTQYQGTPIGTMQVFAEMTDGEGRKERKERKEGRKMRFSALGYCGGWRRARDGVIGRPLRRQAAGVVCSACSGDPDSDRQPLHRRPSSRGGGVRVGVRRDGRHAVREGDRGAEDGRGQLPLRDDGRGREDGRRRGQGGQRGARADACGGRAVGHAQDEIRLSELGCVSVW